MLQQPLPLSTGDPGSFALRTIVERKPRIIAQVIECHQVPAGTRQPGGTFEPEASFYLRILPARDVSCPVGTGSGAALCTSPACPPTSALDSQMWTSRS